MNNWPVLEWCDEHDCFHSKWGGRIDHERIYPVEHCHHFRHGTSHPPGAPAGWIKAWYAERTRLRAASHE